MNSSVNRPAPEPLDPGPTPAVQGEPVVDVPGVLAGRIAQEYASEERRQRHERTDRILREAADLGQMQ